MFNINHERKLLFSNVVAEKRSRSDCCL